MRRERLPTTPPCYMHTPNVYTHTCTHTRSTLHIHQTLATDTLEYYVGNCLHKFVQDVDNSNTWTGLWTEEQRRRLLTLIESHPRYRGNPEQHGHKWDKAAGRILVGLGYGARQLIRHRHTKDEPLHGVKERLAALLKQGTKDDSRKKLKNKKIRVAKVEKIRNRTRTLLGNFVRSPLPPPEPPPPQHPP